MGRVIRLGLAIALVGGMLAAPSAAAAADVEFGTPTATAVFGDSITFEQPVTVRDVASVEVLVTFPSSLGPLVTPMDPPQDGASTLTHSLRLADGHLYPNTHVSARWRLTFDDGSVETGPEASVTYADDRFAWQTAEGDLMTVHWYEGGAAFGERALRIGEEAIVEAEALLGVEETEPIDFFVYADRAEFYGALGPGTRENVGGQAIAGLRTLYALIVPDQINAAWVSIVIPHELTHIVFDTAVENPYSFPPKWLDEGVAMYLSQGYDASERAIVERAANNGTLIPLDGLAGQFPTTRDAFFQAYAQSVSAVDFLVRTQGEDALVDLIASYTEGRTDDEAFTDALGMDTGAFNAAWFESLGATVPDRVGPEPAPAGPLPSAWTGAAVSPSPGATGEPAASPSATPVPGGGGGVGGDDSPTLPIVVGALVLVTALSVAGLAAMRRGTRSGGPPPSEIPGTEPPRIATIDETAGMGEASHGPDA